MKHSNSQISTHSASSLLRRQGPGFALIATISIMALLVMIALGMLSLSSSEVRSSKYDKHRHTAQSNARMAMMIALGELQKSTGSDRRITASSGILGENTAQKHLLGVWDSDGEGLEDGTHLTENNIASTYVTGREPRFRRWLIPGDNNDVTNISFPDSAPSATNSVKMVAGGSLGDNVNATEHIYAPLVSTDVHGKYSWWIDGENSKARVGLHQDIAINTDYSEQLNQALAAPTTAIHTIAGLEQLTRDESVSKIISTNTTRLATNDGTPLDDDLAKQHFFDLSPYSVGLLTNTKFGGMKKDLNLLFEQESLPIDYTDQTATTGITSKDIFEGGLDWEGLQLYYRIYKSIDEPNGFIKWEGTTPVFMPGKTFDDLKTNYASLSVMPAIAKWHWIVSHDAVKTGQNSQGEDQYKLRIYLDNVVEMWNPYNLPYEFPSEGGSKCSMHLKVNMMPAQVAYKIDGQYWQHSGPNGTKVKTLFGNSAKTEIGFWRLITPSRIEPGNIIVFSNSNVADKDNAIKKGGSKGTYRIHPGWHIDGGMWSDRLKTFKQANTNLIGKAGQTVKVEFLQLPSSSKGFTNKGLNLTPKTDAFTAIGFWDGKSTQNTSQHIPGGIQSGHSMKDVALEHKDLDSFTFGDAAAVKQAGVVYSASLRTEKPDSTFPGTDSQLSKSKFYLHSDLIRQNTAMLWGDPLLMAHYPYTFTSKRISAADMLNGALGIINIATDNSGFLGNTDSSGSSGGSSQPGQTHVPVFDLPFVPIISMAQLQHSHVGMSGIRKAEALEEVGNSPTVNFAVGNSFAHPVISADKAKDSGMSPQQGELRSHFNGGSPQNPSTPSGLEQDLYDKSWFANNVLFDSYYFSSVSPQDNPLVSDPKSMDALLLEALQDKGELPNKRYRFKNALSSSEAQTLSTDLLADDGYLNIAEHQICLGSFNVNSISVPAWKAFLGSLDERTLAYLEMKHTAPADFEGIVDESTLSTYKDKLVVSRFTLPANEPANSDEPGGDFLTKRYQGARSLTTNELDELSEKIVEQVKLRGPFLSLGDFLNRRLEDSALGRKGALQAAIDNSSINDSFKTSSDTISRSDISAIGYKHPEAAEGLTGEGAPGYITQADLLMPLAPMIRVRDDTFRIRSYGDARDRNGKILAKAWCEAIVQRTPNYVDSSNKPSHQIIDADGKAVPSSEQLSEVNKSHGRRYTIVSFRWLSDDEV